MWRVPEAYPNYRYMKNLIIILSILFISSLAVASSNNDQLVLSDLEIPNGTLDYAISVFQNTISDEVIFEETLFRSENGNLYIEDPDGDWLKIFYNGKQIYPMDTGCD